MNAGKTPIAQASLEQLVADGLNEHGFLLSQVVREKIRGNLFGESDGQKYWGYVESEYPVTAVDGSQTRVDIVLANGTHYLCLECKRPNPQYKRWVFFDKDQANEGQLGSASVECFEIRRWPMQSDDQASHCIRSLPCRLPCAGFDSYLEIAMKPDGKGGLKASHTETIEDAFRQVIRGQSGLITKLLQSETAGFWRSIPIVVTTAQLYEADFNHNHVSLANGMIEAESLKLRPMEFCAVNYHADDSLSVQSRFALKVRGDIRNDLSLLQSRTMFVVQAEAINRFLNWLHTSLFAS